MDVAGKDDVDTRGEERVLHSFLHPHGLELLLMIAIRVVPRRVNNSHEPRRPPPVHLLQIRLQPPVLVRVRSEGRVGTEHDDVDAGDLEGVEEVGGGSRFLVRHHPPGVVGGERSPVEGLDLLDVVVAVRHHPRPPARQRLDQDPEPVPLRLVHVGVRQVPRQQQHVVVRLRDLVERRAGCVGLPEVT